MTRPARIPEPVATIARPTVLIVEDSPTVSMLCEEFIDAAGFEAIVVETGRDCLAALDRGTPAAMLLDLGLPDMNGLDLLREVKTRGLPTSVVVITSNASLKSAIDAMRLGAFDYVVKPFNGERIATTARNAVQTYALHEEVETYRKQAVMPGFLGLIGSSPQMQAVYRVIESAAASRATVFITGESGTGKELCANAIHAESGRSSGQFVAINCAAIPRELMESEIFGHVKGAFTSATSDRVGAAGRADGGTLFLDEICEMDLDLQAKILRLIQSGTFQRVGASRTESADIRFVCATNRAPWTEVRAGRFREDLLYRLHVIPLELPPLRDRGEDVVQLADSFLRRIAAQEQRSFSGFSEDALALLRAYPWPGNVRELENALHSAVVLNSGSRITASMFPRRIREVTGAAILAARPAERATERPGLRPDPDPDLSRVVPFSAPASADDIMPLWQVEKAAIQRALELCGGNVPQAASRLGIGVSTIYRKKAEWARSARAVSRAGH